jgi:hypothetical protein
MPSLNLPQPPPPLPNDQDPKVHLVPHALEQPHPLPSVLKTLASALVALELPLPPNFGAQDP